MKILIKADYILTMNKDDEVIEDGFVLIENDKILKFGKLENLKEDVDYIIDDRPNILLPGFINTHTHIAMVGFRGFADDKDLMDWLNNYIWPAENRAVDREFIKLASELAICEMIRTGTTTYNDMYFFQEITAEVSKEIGIRAFLGEGLIDFPTPSFKKPEDGIKIVESFIKNYLNDEFIYPTLCLHAPYSCSKELILKGFEIAKKYNIPIHMHVAETKAEVEIIKNKYNLTPVRFLNSIGVLEHKFISAHSVYLDDEEIEIFKEKNVGVAHNPQSNMKLSSGVAPIVKMLNKGINVGIATDGTASNNNLDIIDEMRSCALIHKVYLMDPKVASAKDVLKMATIYGAKVLGIDNKVGSIEIGKKADLITISLNNFHLMPIYDPYSAIVYSANGLDVSSVIINGKIIMEKGDFKNIDVEKVKYNGKRLKEKVLNN
ncbi:MAG: amidohydrolase [candidate division WOR-3 bacterium]